MNYTTKKQLARNVPKYQHWLKLYIISCVFTCFFIGFAILGIQPYNQYITLYMPEIKLGLIAVVVFVNIINRIYKQNHFLNDLIILDCMMLFNIVFLSKLPILFFIAILLYNWLDFVKTTLPKPEQYDYRNTRTTTTYSRKYVKQKHTETKTKHNRTYHKIR